MRLAESDVVQIVEAVWSSTLDMQFERTTLTVPSAEPTMTSIVQMTGLWQGAVTLRCLPELAGRIAAAMFGTAPSEASPDEVRDALGEVVNMIAGNLKIHLPAGCQLSLPAVVEGREYRVGVPGTSVLIQLSLATDGHPFMVGVLERNAH
ncbi:MAG: chemotaxis protein CheX [Deltaproteobacteria bacterium]|nr:chemotaxis protein CheX [Deltaproteobacteria bacterium]